MDRIYEKTLPTYTTKTLNACNRSDYYQPCLAYVLFHELHHRWYLNYYLKNFFFCVHISCNIFECRLLSTLPKYLWSSKYGPRSFEAKTFKRGGAHFEAGQLFLSQRSRVRFARMSHCLFDVCRPRALTTCPFPMTIITYDTFDFFGLFVRR